MRFNAFNVKAVFETAVLRITIPIPMEKIEIDLKLENGNSSISYAPTTDG